MNKKFSLGFTLIELLVSIAIIITTTTVVVAILASSFTGITKSSISEDVRQNGNSALSRMTRTIQFAESFQGVSKDGVDYVPSCSLSGGETYNYVKVKTNTQIVTLSCTNADIMMGTSSLLDKNKVSVLKDSCAITCLQENISTPPVIGISFGLFNASATDQKKSESFFSTSVKMRNL